MRLFDRLHILDTDLCFRSSGKHPDPSASSACVKLWVGLVQPPRAAEPECDIEYLRWRLLISESGAVQVPSFWPEKQTEGMPSSSIPETSKLLY